MQASFQFAEEHDVDVIGTAAVEGKCAFCLSDSSTIVAASLSCEHTPESCRDCMAMALDVAVEKRPHIKAFACPFGCGVSTMI